jgi:8-oxo-dGTP pyrophosphatase MutT (NUDIX family)
LSASPQWRTTPKSRIPEASLSDARIVPADCLPYRPCVGIMVLNRAGLAWAGHRIVEAEGEMEGAEHLWQMPQGGIDRGETALEAAGRELYADRQPRPGGAALDQL